MKKEWKLIYPDKTEELTNYNPVEFERKETLKDFSDWFKKEFYGDDDISTEIYDKIMNKLKEIEK